MPQGLQNLSTAIAQMRRIATMLDPDDGVACFNRMYLQVTTAFANSLASGHFHDPHFMETLGTNFADLYLKAVEADQEGRPVHPSWAPLFDARHDATIPAIRFAMAGMITHINHDLPLALVTTCQKHGANLASASIRADFLRINQVLYQLEPDIRSAVSRAPAHPGPKEAIKQVMARWSIAGLRNIAWSTSRLLWCQRSAPTHLRLTLTILALATARAGVLLTRGTRP
ncbi:DUF5995 family protein [Streptomyces chilikensis]|uniref:DUF5995 family protein n=1 Tax=Streptomyces chilikensis TaxID=1194079 RepID=UPI000B006B6B|nr:DUF5995 family protein [Streptomyces chilikensis]